MRMTALCLALVAASATEAFGRIWYVQNVANGTNSGESWTNAFVELQSALAVAQAGDQIWVAQGTYRPDYDPAAQVHTTDRAAYFELKSGVAIYGGFAGDEPLLEHRAGEFDNTILSGDIGYPDFAEDNTYHVVKAINVDETCILDGFSIRGGRAPSILFETCGGGMVLEASSPTITNCLFTDNQAHQVGGGLCTWKSHALISKCRFVSNSAISEGGAIYNASSAPTLVDCLFAENKAMRGGAISNYASSPRILRSSFEGNEAHYQGGALYNHDYSSPVITSCSFRENLAGGGGALAISEVWPTNSTPTTITESEFQANEAYSGGGAVYAFYANVEVRQCDFSANVTYSGGGGAINTYSTELAIDEATFFQNVSYGSGGAIDVGSSQGVVQMSRFLGNESEGQGGGVNVSQNNGDMELKSCEFIANSAKNGGAISNTLNGHIRVVLCTIVGNLVQFDGPAVFGQQDTVTEISDSIMRENFSPFPGQIENRLGSLTTVTHSNIEGGWIGDGNVDSDEDFVRDPFDGGDGWGDDSATPFVEEGANDDFGDLRLQPGSPAINSGDPDFVPETSESDLDGHARVLCGRVDMGAYEFGIGDVNCDQVVDLGDFAAWPPCSLGVTPLPGECVPLDFDNDKDVDLVDFARLQRLNWIK